MNQNSKMDTDYKKELRQVRSAVRGNYRVIAERTGLSLDTVKSVMIFKFRNDDILREAKKLAEELN